VISIPELKCPITLPSSSVRTVLFHAISFSSPFLDNIGFSKYSALLTSPSNKFFETGIISFNILSGTKLSNQFFPIISSSL
jgi:hypothetical protein